MKKLASIILAFIIALSAFPFAVNAAPTSTTRYNVLIIDVSSSMDGEPFEMQKQAAINFCTSLASSADTNYLACVEISATSETLFGFTTDIAQVTNAISGTYAYSGTNMENALSVAYELLNDVNDSNAIKNIILCSDGIPEHGRTTSVGHYTSSDNYSHYAYGNAVYDTAATITNSGISLYTLGFFHSLSGDDLEFGRRLLNDIQNAGYYEVTDPSELLFAFGDIASQISNELQEVSVKYCNRELPCWYSDDYFSESAYHYNAHLATMSLGLAMSAFGAPEGGQSDYSNKDANVRDLLDQLNFKKDNTSTVEVNEWYINKPTRDSIACAVGSKEIITNGEKSTLIAVAVRGGGYEAEWASNFTIGSQGMHAGFEEAMETVYSFVQDYISDYGLSGDVKFWITGYSRAAAVSNLLAGKLDNTSPINSNISYSNDDIYAYCFETPAGALTKDVGGKALYNNIFNIVNKNDPVPYVAPAAFGFCRYGKDKYLPTKGDNDYDESKKKMLEFFEEYKPSGTTYNVDDFKMKKVDVGSAISGDNLVVDDKDNNWTQRTFLNNYVEILATEILGSRSEYHSTFESEVREICSVMFGYDDETTKEIIDYFSENVDLWVFLKCYFYTSMDEDNTDAYDYVYDLIIKALEHAGVTDYDKNELKAASEDITELLVATVISHPNYFVTAFQNFESLGQGHFPELCFAWVASMDTNYDPDARENFNNGGYRIIHINCAVDIDVFDENGNLISSITNETIEENPAIECGIDENGQKYVILNNEEDFDISITAREDDLVNVNIEEFSALAGTVTRNINYFDVQMAEGEKLSGSIPSYSDDDIENETLEGSYTNYYLYDNSGNEITPDSDIRGESAIEKFTVTATTKNTKFGIVDGGGVYNYGTFAKVTAVPAENESFIGWYNGKELVSKDAEYRFRVENDVALTAKFTSNTATDNNSSGMGLIIGICSGLGVLLIAITVMAVLMAMKGNKKPEPEPAPPPPRAALPPNAPFIRKPDMFNSVSPVREKSERQIAVRFGSDKIKNYRLIDGRKMKVGKDEKWATVIIPEKYKNASRKHCTIMYSESEKCYYVEDLSTNGICYSDGKMLKKGINKVKSNSILVIKSAECKIKLR